MNRGKSVKKRPKTLILQGFRPLSTSFMFSHWEVDSIVSDRLKILRGQPRTGSIPVSSSRISENRTNRGFVRPLLNRIKYCYTT